jgi:hypothetical protein
MNTRDDVAGVGFGATLSQTTVAQLDHHLTVSDNDNTLDAQLLTAVIFSMTGTVEYMLGDTLLGQMTSGGSRRFPKFCL